MTALLVIIYISFISLGLPDSLFGSAWPVMRMEIGASFDIAGYVSMTMCAGTVVSSLLSNRLITKFGAGKVTAVSTAMTAVAILLYGMATNVWMLFLIAVPMGLGAGSVDAALNNFVALHYKARHMSWLHCFWGLGATVGPMIMASQFSSKLGWRQGFIIVAAIQAALVIILFVSLPLWKKVEKQNFLDSDISNDKKDSLKPETAKKEEKPISNMQAFKIRGVKFALLTFFAYCAGELVVGLWSSTYLTADKGASAEMAAMVVSAYFGAITLGRLVAGFATIKLSGKTMIRIGQAICVVGVILLALPVHVGVTIAGIALIGFGEAPIYPSMMQEVPGRFGRLASQAVIGLQMAFAYLGSTFIPSLFGLVASATTTKIFPYFVMAFIALMVVSSEILNMKVKKNKSGDQAGSDSVSGGGISGGISGNENVQGEPNPMPAEGGAVASQASLKNPWILGEDIT